MMAGGIKAVEKNYSKAIDRNGFFDIITVMIPDFKKSESIPLK